jgi:class 3 adenylate cyclase
MSDLFIRDAAGAPNAVTGEDYAAPLRRFLQSRHGRRVTLTVLFTDIEGATTLADQLGDAAWDELRREHDSLALPILKQEGAGFHVKSIGDALWERE